MCTTRELEEGGRRRLPRPLTASSCRCPGVDWATLRRLSSSPPPPLPCLSLLRRLAASAASASRGTTGPRSSATGACKRTAALVWRQRPLPSSPQHAAPSPDSTLACLRLQRLWMLTSGFSAPSSPPYSDEHYFPTLLAALGKENETYCDGNGVASADWRIGGPHPRSYKCVRRVLVGMRDSQRAEGSAACDCMPARLWSWPLTTLASFCSPDRPREVTYAHITRLRSLIADKDMQPTLCEYEGPIRGTRRSGMLRSPRLSEAAAHACVATGLTSHSSPCPLPHPPRVLPPLQTRSACLCPLSRRPATPPAPPRARRWRGRTIGGRRTRRCGAPAPSPPASSLPARRTQYSPSQTACRMGPTAARTRSELKAPAGVAPAACRPCACDSSSSSKQQQPAQ